ncbi:hypothetical protein TH25_21320 [Thalassospira profundimaris]|uniref:Lipoprotein n=1 Tax=Thalassospira profundimaris TaxID=502049 RepID=A0A367WSV5_9PROT|nr:hypothetical protein [Thalassospira profundimaris]RCK43690.1 hypothetical protein TH25_21320 [Thalassospira profundimaris]
MKRLSPLRLVCFVAVTMSLAGCAFDDIELPKDGTGVDKLKESPCVCDPVEFNSEGYTWRG